MVRHASWFRRLHRPRPHGQASKAQNARRPRESRSFGRHLGFFYEEVQFRRLAGGMSSETGRKRSDGIRGLIAQKQIFAVRQSNYRVRGVAPAINAFAEAFFFSWSTRERKSPRMGEVLVLL
jgi:hypothetical protein